MNKPALLLALLAAVPGGVPAVAREKGEVAGRDGVRLRALFAEADAAALALNPVQALYRGDLRHADRLGDYLTDGKDRAERALLERNLAGLARVDRARLGAVDRIAFDVFRHGNDVALRGHDPAIRQVADVLTINHFSGWQSSYPDIASGEGAAPFRTVADYQNNLKRNAQYAALVDRMIARARAGLARGVTSPKLVVGNVIGQLDALLAARAEDSIFYRPIRRLPDTISVQRRQALAAAYAAQVRDVIDPAHRRLRAFLADEYLPRARASVGLAALPGGAAYYRWLIEENTTLPLTADAVHALGLSEVARIRDEMARQQARVGFQGTLPEFFGHLRTDPRFQPKTAEQVREGYGAIGRRVDARVREQFAIVPRTRLAIRPVPAYRAKSAAAGSYEGGTPDGSRPGVFFYNTYDLPNRYLWGMETLYLHEAVPGHHFQVSLAQENTALPAFMRFGGNTAFIEGWALYAETLWPELGVESDPYQRMGGLNDEMLRAMRLVVDSGLHAKGWSRDAAIRYMLDNSPMPEVDATAEVERYIAIPGQALAYKVGQLAILRLKAEARAALGARFDPRAFHRAVLDTGALPMPVLEAKVRGWIAAAGAGAGAGPAVRRP